LEKIPYFFVYIDMYSLKINDNEFPIKIKLFRTIPILYEDELSKSESTKIDINSNNKIEIMKDNKIIKEYCLSPIIENFKEIFYRMKNNEIYCNVDIYEELIPFKYIIKKVDNNLYYESLSFLFNNSIEK
jgi:hypothetical protein